MELIIIRGQRDGGKSTTSAMVHNALAKKKANLLYFKLPCNEIETGKKAQDFFSVFEYLGKKIAIISRGDDAATLDNDMTILIEMYHPIIIVVCARSIDRQGSAYNMLTEKYGNLIKNENIFWSQFDDDYSQITKCKADVVGQIMNRINDIKL